MKLQVAVNLVIILLVNIVLAGSESQTASSSKTSAPIVDSAFRKKWLSAEGYRKSADEGFAGAQYNLGVCYFSGEGVETNLTESVKWFRKAAEQGLAIAQYNLGLCYVKGYGVEKDKVEGLAWLTLAATFENNDYKAERDKVEQQLDKDSVLRAKERAKKWAQQIEQGKAKGGKEKK